MVAMGTYLTGMCMYSLEPQMQKNGEGHHHRTSLDT